MLGGIKDKVFKKVQSDVYGNNFENVGEKMPKYVFQRLGAPVANFVKWRMMNIVRGDLKKEFYE